MAGNKNSGSPTLNDRKLAADVRRLTLKQIERILKNEPMEEKEVDFKRQVILRLAGSILPRLTEVTGEGGGEVKVTFTHYGDSKQ